MRDLRYSSEWATACAAPSRPWLDSLGWLFFVALAIYLAYGALTSYFDMQERALKAEEQARATYQCRPIDTIPDVTVGRRL